ncbi:MAG: hypothetical protein J3K34DRAFT_140754 [Monoraphidium minutum]|nr:MAG: hypothetical protein J3K34DRAFT_140754 [Monoraphidium minutum]
MGAQGTGRWVRRPGGVLSWGESLPRPGRVAAQLLRGDGRGRAAPLGGAGGVCGEAGRRRPRGAHAPKGQQLGRAACGENLKCAALAWAGGRARARPARLGAGKPRALSLGRRWDGRRKCLIKGGACVARPLVLPAPGACHACAWRSSTLVPRGVRGGCGSSHAWARPVARTRARYAPAVECIVGPAARLGAGLRRSGPRFPEAGDSRAPGCGCGCAAAAPACAVRHLLVAGLSGRQ